MKTVSNFFSAIVMRYPKIIISITIVLTIFLGYGIIKLEVASEFGDDLPANDPLVQTKRYFQEVFGTKYLLFIGIEKTPTIYNPSTLQKVKDISEEIKHLNGIIEDEVISIATANNIKGRDWGLEVGAFMKDVPQTEEEIEQLRKDVQGNDMFYGRLVSKDETLTMIIASMEKINGKEKDKLVEDLYSLAKRFEGTEKFYFTGDPIGDYEIDRGIQHDMNRLMPFALLLILAGFSISFRRLRGVLIPTAIMILSIIWTMGLMGHLGYKINVVTSIIPMVMLAIVSSYGIHIIYRYYEVTPSIHNSLHASGEAVSRVAQALLMAGITSAIGTVTLVIFKIVSIKEFGLFLSIGIVFGFLLSLTFAPALLTLLKHQTNNIAKDNSKKEDIFDRLMPKLAGFTMRNRIPLMVITGIVFMASLIGISQIKVGINFVDFFPKDHRFTISANKFNDKVGGSNPLNIMIETPEPDGIKNPEVLRKMLKLENYARGIEGVGNTDSFARLIKRMHYVMNGEKKEFDVIPDSQELIAQYLLLYSMSGNPGDFDNLVDYEYRRVKVNIYLTTFDQERQREIFDEIQDYTGKIFPGNTKIAYEGLVRWIAQTDYVVTGKIQNIISSILVVFLFCTAVYRSLRLGILSIMPLTVATLLTFGIMGFLGIRLNMATAIITSIAVGVGVDFAIHYITHFREEIISLTMVTVSIGTLLILPVLFSFIDVKSLAHRKEAVMGYETKIRWAVVSIGLIFWFLFTFGSAFSEGLSPNVSPIETFGNKSIGELTARQIMERNDEVGTSKDSTSSITMKLINEKGQERMRKVSYWEKRDKEDNRNTLVKFQFPADVKGTGFLTLEHKGSEDDQWLYLPAMRKTRRISASDKGDSFMGSDFTYEDMEQEDMAEFEYKLLGVEDMKGEACYRIEGIAVSESKKKETSYSRRELWIRKTDFTMLKINYYNKKGDFFKTLTASDIKMISNKPRAHKLVMENFQRKHKTELLYEEISLDEELSDSLFTERQLVKE
ncbi:MAG: outer membrane lipoprotein-sorting protein [Nitrospinae bacterium]|nr:outer membrane lipoprotein-sorting protein [Nitrospinota bacterium]